MDADEVLGLYEFTRVKCFAAAEEADRRPKLTSLAQVIAPLAPYTPAKVAEEARRFDYAEKRLAVFGGEAKLPENQPPRHLAILINNALHDLFCKYPEALLFGEDVAQKGGVYTVTKGLQKSFKGARVFNTLAGRDDHPRAGPGFRQHGHAAAARDPVPGVFPQCLRPDSRRGLFAAVLLATTSTATRW